MKALDLACYIVKKTQAENYPLTLERLQQLLYFSDGYYLKEFGKIAFEEEIIVEESGPIVQTVSKTWNEKRNFFSQEKDTKIPVSLAKLVDRILEASVDLSTEALAKKVDEAPFFRNFCLGKSIPTGALLAYFGQHDPLNLKEKAPEPILTPEEMEKIISNLFEKRADLYRELAKL